jgi:hypothetical protein
MSLKRHDCFIVSFSFPFYHGVIGDNAMTHVQSNPNPMNKRVGDCVVRAVALATDSTWNDAYMQLCLQGYAMADMPSSNNVWGAYLREKGFTKHNIDDCKDCYTVRDFAQDHPEGTYVLGTGTHAVAVMDGGNYFDSWDSGDEVVLYYYEKGESNE